MGRTSFSTPRPDAPAWRHLRYLEGLRAVAIRVVVVAHANLSGFKGGFVGVYVFSVLSGYLITGLLSTELKILGAIGSAAFYARRFRRLLTALLLVLAVTLALGIVLPPISQHAMQADGAGSAALFLSNIYFAFANRPSCLASVASSSAQSSCPSPAKLPRGAEVYAWIRKGMHALPHVVFLDLNDLVCPQGTCRAMLDGRVVFRDDHHMTASFSRSLAGQLATRMGQPDHIDASAPTSDKSPMAGVSTAALH